MTGCSIRRINLGFFFPCFFGLIEAGSCLTTNLSPVADTTLMEPFPTNNLGGAGVLLVGTGENLKRHRALLQFDLTGIPSHSKIKSASLTLELARVPANGFSPSAMGLHRLLRPWGEGNKVSPTNCTSCVGQGMPATTNEACWVTPFALTTNAWTSPGGAAGADYIPSESSSQVIFTYNDSPYTFYSSAPMVADVQMWLDNPQTNYGWMLIAQEESTAFTARRLYSREDPFFAPYLTLQYIVPPIMDHAQRNDNQFTFFFTASPGQHYIVEFRNSLSSNWQTLADAGSFPEETRVLVIDPVTNQRFYRVRTY